MTETELRKRTETILAGVVDRDDACVDARELVRFAGGDEEKLSELVKRRLDGEPLQYIIGEWDFYNCTFRVGEGVLIPRPETEFLVEKALEFMRGRNGPFRVLDLCSGSGCIAVSVAANCPDCRVYAVEKSPAAFEYLKQNIVLNDVRDRVTAFCDDVISGCSYFTDRARPVFDIILSNPPYVRSAECEFLQREVMREPRMALDGGPDGLMFYRAIVKRWLPLLKPDGMLLFECGEEEAADVEAIIAAAHTGKTVQYDDFNGICRFAGINP